MLQFSFLWLLAAVGVLGVLGCSAGLVLLLARLVRGNDPGRADHGRRGAGCLIGAAAALAFLTLGGLSLLGGGLLLAGAVIDEGLEHVQKVEFEVLPPAEAAAIREAWVQAAPAQDALPAGEVVLRLTLRGHLSPTLRDELRQGLQRAVGHGELPPLRVETPPGLDHTLVEVLLPITGDELQEVRRRLHESFGGLRELEIQLERL